MVSRVIPVDPFDLVIFGGTGDLARGKILPALYRRWRAGQIPPGARVIGAARAAHDDDSYRALVAESLENGGEAEDLAGFLGILDYQRIDVAGEAGWEALAARLSDGGDRVTAYYFSVAPGLFGSLAARLQAHGLAGAGARVVVEKPFGNDLGSARKLNRDLAAHFDESQIYRIDHYLGKETVQNL
ncbi:glucose-6-phosphate dehydrogenase, partial [Cribrihabitans sp. XS_ASV171]